MYFFLVFPKHERRGCVSYMQIRISSMGSIEDLLILSRCDISNQSVMDTKKIFRNCLRLSQKYSSMDSRVPTLALPQGMILLFFSSMSCWTLRFTQLCICLFACCCYCFIFPCVLNWHDWIHIVLLLELIFLVVWVWGLIWCHLLSWKMFGL